MPSLRAIFTADATPFAKELRTTEKLAERAARNIERSMSSTNVSAHTGQSGVIRETLVMMREISAGNWSRVPGSFSILLSRLGVLKFLFTDNASAAKVLADAHAQLATTATAAAVAATRKAAASAAAFQAETENTEATLAAAIADEEAAVAARANAAAMVQKAEAASTAAAAEGAAAVAGVGVIGMIGGALIGLGIGAYNAYKLTSNLVDKLSGLKLPDFHPEYIAKHLQAVNQTAQGWKKIGEEIAKAVEKYDSATEAAKRFAEASKAQFEHERKMLDIAKDRDLATAKTPQQKLDVEAKYAAKELELSARERQSQFEQRQAEAAALEAEGRRKKAQADAINVPSAQHDKNVAEKLKQDADAAQKFLDAAQKSRTEGRPLSETYYRLYNATPGVMSGVSNADVDAAQKADEAEAQRRIRAAKDFQDTSAANDELRKRKEDLTKAAGEALGKAAETFRDLPNLRKSNATANSNEQAEAPGKAGRETRRAYGQRPRAPFAWQRQFIAAGGRVHISG